MSKRNAKLAVLYLAAAILLQPLLAWATENCYPYDTCRNCRMLADCGWQSVYSHWCCKQLTAIYPDPGCCSYYKNTLVFYTNVPGYCPCDNGQTYDVISNVQHGTAFLCHRDSGAIAPCNTDVEGSCYYDFGHSCL